MNLRNLFLGVTLGVSALPVIGCGQGGSGRIEATQSEIDEYKAQKAEDKKNSDLYAAQNPSDEL